MPRKLFSRTRILFFGLSVLVFPAAVYGQTDKQDLTIEQLVELLASPSYLQREEAQRKLADLKEQAKPALEKVVDSPDIEQRLRARSLLQEIRRTQLWEPSTVTWDQKQLSILDAFRIIADQTDNPVNWDLTPKTLNQKVDVRWEETPYWHAMDQLSRQAEVVPRFYDDPNRAGVVLTHGFLTSGPVCYAGPVRASLLYARHHKSETLNYADSLPDKQESLEMTLALHWEQDFPLCRYGHVKVLEATTDQGEDLMKERSTRSTLMHVVRRQRQLVLTFPLVPPKKPASRLDKLMLNLDLVAAGDFVAVPLGLENIGDVSSNAGYQVELAEFERKEKQTSITIRWTRPIEYDKMNMTDMVDEYLELFDARGKSLPFQQQKVLGNSRQVQYTLLVSERVGIPKQLVFHVATLKSAKTVEFDFQAVPLPSTVP